QRGPSIRAHRRDRQRDLVQPLQRTRVAEPATLAKSPTQYGDQRRDDDRNAQRDGFTCSPMIASDGVGRRRAGKEWVEQCVQSEKLGGPPWQLGVQISDVTLSRRECETPQIRRLSPSSFSPAPPRRPCRPPRGDLRMDIIVLIR